MAKQYKLIIEIRQGFDLVDKKWVGGHAAFVEAHVNSKTQKTHESNNLENPKWNSRLNFTLESIPEKIVIEVREMRALLPNPKLGDYVINIKNKLNLEELLQPYTIQDGVIELQNTKRGRLDLSVIIQPIDIEQVNIESKKHILSTSNVQEKEIVMGKPVEIKPKIIHEEVVIEKPAEIEQKIIHEEKPIIKEQYESIQQQQQQQQQQQDILQNTNQMVQEKPIIAGQENLNKQHIYEKVVPEAYIEQTLLERK